MAELVKINKIKVGERRREKLGDLKTLAKSIEKYGLLHAIVIDEHDNLVAGERRLRACQLLERKHIEATRLGELSKTELREIELDENLKRKNLTREEKARVMIEQASIAARVITEAKNASSNNALLGDSPNKTNGANKRGAPPKEEATQQEIADRMGVSRRELSRAEVLTQAVERYPVLKSIGGDEDDVIRMARNLDKASEENRKKFINLIKLNDSDTVTDLAEKPRMPKPDPEKEKRRKGEERWLELLYEISVRVNSINSLGGMTMLADGWSEKGRINALKNVQNAICSLQQWEEDLERVTDGHATTV